MSGSGILGTERDLIIGAGNGNQQNFSIGGGVMSEQWTFPNQGGGANFAIDYDGVQGGTGVPDRARQMPVTDLTQGGADNAIEIPILSVTGNWTFYIEITSGSGNAFLTQMQVTTGASNLDFPYANFAGNANLTQANGIYVSIIGPNGPSAITIGPIVATNVPEPSTLILAALGGLALLVLPRK